MASIGQHVANDTASSLIEQFCEAVLELEACKDVSENKVQWTEIEQHFRNLEMTLKKKSEELEAKEKEYKEKEAETCALIAEREAAVATKEQDYLDRVQELKDAAVAAIAEAHANFQPTSAEPLDAGDNKDTKLPESFPPVPLLKAYLKNLRRNSQGKGGNSGGAAGAQGDVNAQELEALRAVIRCVQEYGLEANYPLDPLQKRFAQLEKAKSDNRKRVGDFGKRHQPKKSRPNGGFRGFRGPPGRQAPPVYNERAAYAGMPERYPHTGPHPYDYQVPNQPAYAQANDQRLYYYSQDDRSPAPSYNAATSNYGSYSSSGLQPSHQPYM